ncbi:MAG: hypothetical protein JWR19_3623 [Pedosphaera sp.]|nr:hypothetical protein [Pedosphaera sp.]
MNIMLGTFFNWLARTSWQAAVLVVIVLLVQAVFRKRLSARWRHALWLLVVARMLLPAAPHSAMSLFNYAGLENVGGKSAPINAVPPPASVSPVVRSPERNSTIQLALPSANVQSFPREADIPQGPTTVATSQPPSVHAGIFADRTNLVQIGALVWAIGVGLLAMRLIGQNLAFIHRLRTADPVTEPKVLALFEQCKTALGIHFPIGLVETAQVNSPALHGFFHPCLLLPVEMIGGFSEQELRHIFLHELAHIKRRDMAVHWAAALLKILHWFNPVLWLGFRRMASDRELACDELALSHAGEAERKPYGAAIIKVLETCAGTPALAGVMGILEDKDQMTRRISMILKFRQHSRWPVLAMLLLLAIGLVTLTDAQSGAKSGTESTPRSAIPARADIAQAEVPSGNPEKTMRFDLTGHVLSEDGSPVAATVFISTAGPKVGSSTFCPSCYADCRKSAKSDAQGAFNIEALDSQLLFRILVVAKGYAPKFVSEVDPVKGAVEVKLKPSDPSQAGAERSLRGRVVDPKGNPIEGAVVNAHGIRQKDGSAIWGTLTGVDPLAVTDGQGEFIITALNPFESMDVRVEARAFANKTFTQLASGMQRHDLIMTEGVTVSGRVMLNGQALKNVSVGIVSVDRGMENFTGNFEIGTDASGHFAFMNLPPKVDYYVYGLMNSLKPYGAIPIVKLHTGSDGETTEVGDLVVVPAYRLSGRVVLADGQAVPPKTQLLVDRQDAWDVMQLTLGQDGSFDIGGIPAGKLSLSVRVPGYAAARQNASLDTMNPYQLIGRVEGNITNLVFLLEKGKELEPDWSQSSPESSQPWNRPLHGSEAGIEHTHDWAVSGRITDSETQAGIRHFRVIPGNADLTFGLTRWDAQHAVDGTNGDYTVHFDKRWGQPMLQVTAEGYLPDKASVLPLQQTPANLILKKGSGPTGRVLLPDGKVAAGVGVLLICANDRNMGLGSAGQLNPYQNKTRLSKTDATGHFSFEPELGMQLLVAAAPEGVKRILVETLKTDSNIVLEPYGRISGTLKRASGPGTNEDLDLAFQDETNPVMNHINLANHARTDDQGRFEFDGVPPGRLQISYRQINAGRPMLSWNNKPLQQVTLKPAQTLEVKIEAADRPATQDSLAEGIRQPEPSRVQGIQIKGRVLLPNGKPAADAQVALQVRGKYLALAKASFSPSGAREEGLIVNTGPGGEFTLPMYDGATAVVALNEEGFAKVTLAGLKAAPQITLQAWGRIEGTLHIGRHLGTNQMVVLRQSGFDADALIFDFNEFQVKTDDQAHFVITYVPPGEQTFALMIPQGDSGQTSEPLGLAVVKSGGVTQVSLGGTGETVIGKANFSESGMPVDWKRAQGSIHTSFPKPMEELKTKKTPQEQLAYQQTEEFKSAMKAAWKDFHYYPVMFSDDGSFVAHEVPPGKYEFDVHKFTPGEMPRMGEPVIFWHGEITVAKAADQSSDAPVDLGIVELKSKTVTAGSKPE